MSSASWEFGSLDGYQAIGTDRYRFGPAGKGDGERRASADRRPKRRETHRHRGGAERDPRLRECAGTDERDVVGGGPGFGHHNCLISLDGLDLSAPQIARELIGRGVEPIAVP